MNNNEFTSWFYRFQQQALMLNERRIIVLEGSSKWASSLLKLIDVNSCNGAQCTDKAWLIYGDSECIQSNVVKQRFQDKLGSESDFVIFQDDNLSIDALAGLSGTLVAGGVFFLLVNDVSQVIESHFYKRFFTILKVLPNHVLIEQSQLSLPIMKAAQLDGESRKPCFGLSYHCKTKEQQDAVEAVIKVLKGKRNRPLVLTADRGRGKSSALAIACIQILNAASKDNQLRIIVTATSINSLTVFFKHLKRGLPEGNFQDAKLTAENGVVEFVPIDQLLSQPINVSLVLVDEAAAIPIYLLEQLLERYSRLVFSSTIHGYEGAGRGFTLKFQKSLRIRYPKYKNLHLLEPIRWGVNDPLEKLVFEACLLNSELPILNSDVEKYQPSTLSFKHFTSTELIADEVLFKQVFSVLVTAHYQTKPSDAKMLLDNEQVELVCLLSTTKVQQVLGVALLIAEGNGKNQLIELDDISAVNKSKKRLRNNFVPQSLSTQCGIEFAFDYSYIRVMRIAIHPQLQKKGLGTLFLDKIAEFSTLQKVDYIASSFGATKELLSFWLTNDFKLARIGFTKDKASGEQSALVLKALTQRGKITLEDINVEFYRSFEYLLTDEYKHIAADLVALILYYFPNKLSSSLSVRDESNIKGFADGYRQYSTCVFSLHLWLRLQLSHETGHDDNDLLIFISRVMQKYSIQDVCNMYEFTGKKNLEQFLRKKIKILSLPN